MTLDRVGQSGTVQQITLLQSHLSSKWRFRPCPRDKAKRATAEVGKAAAESGGGLEVVELDLASLKSVRAAADKLVADGRSFNVIIANAAVMATPLEEVGGKYCEDCQVAELIPADSPVSAISMGVRGYALDPESAKALWKKSEEMVDEAFA